MSYSSSQLAGFPVKQMLVISLIRFSEPLAFTSLFPYLYFMIRDFHIAKEEKDISKYSGYLASCFAFCQFIFSVRWGKLSNRVGRKPVLLMGLLGTSISLILFGFSPNYYAALASRSLAGCLNGNVGVLRTTVGEIATQKKHQALAFSALPLLFNLGSVIGPLIGGSHLFTRPRLDNPYRADLVYDGHSEQDLGIWSIGLTYESFVTRYPYALSNIVVSCFLWFSFTCGLLFLEETNESFKDRRDYGIDLGDKLLQWLGFETKPRPWHKLALTDSTPLLLDSSSSIMDIEQLDAEFDPVPQKTVEAPKVNVPIFTKEVITVIISNCIISTHGMIYSEFTPVFLASSFHSDNKFPFRVTGGYGLDPSMIGTLFSSTGIMGILIILLIFPYIDRKLGTIRGYRFSLSIFPLVYLMIPLVIFTLPQYSNLPAYVTPVLLYILTCCRTLASATGMPQVMLLNHRAAAKEHRAYVNSFTISTIALARCMGPIAFGYIMSFGNQNHIAWLGWWLLSLWAVGGFVQSLSMGDNDD